MNNCFCLAFVLAFAAQEALAQTAYADRWASTGTYLLEMAEAMPAEGYGLRPADSLFTFDAQLQHLQGNIHWIVGSFLDGDRPVPAIPETPAGKEARLYALTETLAYAKTVLAGLTDSLLQEYIYFPPARQETAKSEILHVLFDHTAHHRGQLVVYLRLQGIKPPRYRAW